MLCQALPSLLQAMTCLDRIEDHCQETPETAQSNSDTELCQMQHRTSNHGNMLAVLRDADIAKIENGETVLRGLNLNIKCGITIVTGSIGCGKSTLLDLLAGGCYLNSGSLSRRFSRVAYCPQVPWIMNCTIRQNIVGAAGFDEKWYTHVVDLCGLKSCFDSFRLGDMRLAGSHGIGLSGGQKQRIVRYAISSTTCLMPHLR